MAQNSGRKPGRPSIPEVLAQGYQNWAKDNGINLLAVRRRFRDKTEQQRGASRGASPCRVFGRRKAGDKPGTRESKKRYPSFHLKGLGTVGAHRAAYALFVGPIPKKAEIHHRCLENRCVEPEHLDALPPEEHDDREGQRRLKRRRHGDPEPVEVPRRIRERIDQLARTAGIERKFIEVGLDAYAGRDEVQWVENVIYSRSRVPAQIQGRLYAGMVYVGRWEGLEDRLAALAGSLVRCQLDARLMCIRQAVGREDGGAPRCTVLVIPDFPRPSVSNRAQALGRLIHERFQKRVFTVLVVPSLRWLEGQLGQVVHDLIARNYLLLEGAATLAERDSIVERARERCARLAIKGADAHSLVDVARCRAWAWVREDWRDLNTETLERFLDTAVKRELLVRGCEAHGYPRAAAEQMVEKARQVERHRQESPLVRFCSLVALLSGQIWREQGRDDQGGPLDRMARRLVREELHEGRLDQLKPLRLVGEWCSELGVEATEDDLETFAVDALFDAAKQPAGVSKGLDGAVRRRVLSEVLVRACMREDLDRETAERVVTEQVTLGRQQGRVTVPEVAKAVMQAIEGLTGRSLAGGKMEDWLYRWEYAAADPADHDLSAIDFR